MATAKALAGGYDVLHYHAEGPCMMLWIPKLFGIHVVATIHGLDWQRAKWGNFASKMLKQGEKRLRDMRMKLLSFPKMCRNIFRKRISGIRFIFPMESADHNTGKLI